MVAGGSNKQIKVFQVSGSTVTPLISHDVAGSPVSVDVLNGQLLAGLKNGSIVEMKDCMQQTATKENLIECHWDGETWGLTVVEEDGSNMFLTAGDDNRLFLFDMISRKVIGRGLVNLQPPKKKVYKKGAWKGGASSLGKFDFKWQSRALAYNHHLNHVAIARNDGSVSIREVEGIEQAQEGRGDVLDLNKEFRVL